MIDHRFVFIGGMPRSGTSAAYQLVGTHPRVSRLTDTGVGEDEGQFLQSLYLKEDALGGPARFGLHPDAHMTEHSPLAAEAAVRLFAVWEPYWDLSKPVLCEKSPANILRSRFLQAAFPDSSFIFVSRHPVAYALAIRKWSYEYFKAPLSLLIRNWLACQRTLAEDLPHLRHSLLLRYDDVTREPVPWTRKVEDFLHLEPGMDAGVFKGGFNNRYFQSWTKRQYRDGPQPLRNLLKRLWCEAEVRFVERRFEHEINAFGYSFQELYERREPATAEIPRELARP